MSAAMITIMAETTLAATVKPPRPARDAVANLSKALRGEAD